jgi:hypothetical protein
MPETELPLTQVSWIRDLLARGAEIKGGGAEAFATEAEAAAKLGRQAAAVFKYLRFEDAKSKELGGIEIAHKLVAKRERSLAQQKLTEFVVLGADGILRSYVIVDKGEGARILGDWSPILGEAIVSPLQVLRSLVQAIYGASHGVAFNNAVIQRRVRVASASIPHIRGDDVQSITLRRQERRAHRLLVLLYMYTSTGGDTSARSWIHLNYGLLGMLQSELADAITRLRDLGYVSGTEATAVLTLPGIEAAENALMDPTVGTDDLPPVKEVLGDTYPA